MRTGGQSLNSTLALHGLVQCVLLALFLSHAATTHAATLQLSMRTRMETTPGSKRFHTVTETVDWDAEQTAIVVCDMWNDHYCRNSARRVAEMAPRMNQVIQKARDMGMLIIHSPSGCMNAYADTPQRKLAQQAPKVKTEVELQVWCYLDEQHEPLLPISATQPCDDDGAIRAVIGMYERQIDTLEIVEGDAITDSAEAYYLMKQKGIKNVIVMGVHTNICVLGRPFGIRQLVYQGQNVVLMRDMTDAMYNPRDEPFVNHFTGNDLVFEHIERHWCPTITSADILGDQPFRFPGDKRQHLVVVMADDEYNSQSILPPFVLRHLGADFKITFAYASADDRNDIPGVEALDDADIAIWAIRRRSLPVEQLAHFRKFIADGKPLVALRTTSHAFHLRNKPPGAGQGEWREFDGEVWGGNYHDHTPNQLQTFARILEGAQGHPILLGVCADEFRTHGSLYYNRPLAPYAAPLLMGRAETVEQHEPVAWTYQRPHGGKVFYTSLGHTQDYELVDFQRLLRNAVYWAAGLPAAAEPGEEDHSGC